MITNSIKTIKTEAVAQTSRQVQAAGAAWVLSPEDRSNLETQILNYVGIESIERRPTLTMYICYVTRSNQRIKLWHII